MLNPFASFGIYIAEMLIVYLYFSGFLEQRRPTWQCLLLGGLCFTGASALNLLFRNNTVLNLCTSFLAPLLFALSCYRGRLPLKAFYALIFAVLGGTIETAVVAFGATVTGNGFLDYNTNTPLFLLEAISCKGLTFLAVLIAVRFLNPNKSAVKVPPVFLLYPLIGTFCIFIFWRVCAQADCTPENQILRRQQRSACFSRPFCSSRPTPGSPRRIGRPSRCGRSCPACKRSAPIMSFRISRITS